MARDKNAVLEVRGLGKNFGAKAAVTGLSLTLPPGEIYGLIGPNGSGKTTTIKMIAGLYRPSAGTIRVVGIDALASPTKAKRHLGYIPDDPSAYDKLTGREFLHFVAELYGLPRPGREQKVDAMLDLYGLRAIADGLFGAYSRGTKQKISILAALLHAPRLLLVDEPMVGLDPESAMVTKQLFRDFVQRGGSIVLSTHTLTIADEICDRFGLLREGSLVAQGTHAELSARADRLGTLEDVYLALVRQ